MFVYVHSVQTFQSFKVSINQVPLEAIVVAQTEMGNVDRGSKGRKGFQTDREVTIRGFRLQFPLPRERPPALPQQQSGIWRQCYGKPNRFQPELRHGRDARARTHGTSRFCRRLGVAQEEEEEIFGVQEHQPCGHPTEPGGACHCRVHGQEQQEGKSNNFQW